MQHVRHGQYLTLGKAHRALALTGLSQNVTGITSSVSVRGKSSTAAPAAAAAPGDATSTSSRVSGDVRPFKDLPGPGGPPYFGTYFMYKLGLINKDKLFDVFTEWHRQHGAIFRETLLGNTTVHVAHPEAFRLLHASDGRRPRIDPLSEPTLRYRQERGIALGLGNSNDEEWYALRTAAQRLMMRPKELPPFLPGADRVAQDFVRRLEGVRESSSLQQVPDFATWLGRWALESSGVHCFSRRLGYLSEGDGPERREAESLVAASTLQFQLMQGLFASLPVYQLTHIPTPKWTKLFAAEDHLYSTFLKHFNKALEQLKAKMAAQGDPDGRDPGDDVQDDEGNDFRFLRYMLSRDELPLSQVAIITHSLLYDPLSTVKPQVQFLLYLLATNPRAQDRLYEEVQSVIDPHDPCLSPDGLRRMNYFRACFKESVRLMPMVNETKRRLQKDLVLCGYHIPANTLVNLNHFALFRDSSHFPDPDSFVPERWLQEGDSEYEKTDPSIVQPFSVGPRMCIGRRFAEQDMAVLVTRLLQRFRLEWHHPPMGRTYLVLNTPDCPAHFTFRDR